MVLSDFIRFIDAHFSLRKNQQSRGASRILTGLLLSFSLTGYLSAQSGSAHGGSHPIVGGNVYLFEAGLTGYGSAPTPLLIADGTNDVQPGGYIVTAAPYGTFNLTGKYSCTDVNGPVYLVIEGGTSGSSTANPAIELVLPYGSCQSLQVASSVNIDEITTVAAAWALNAYIDVSTGYIGAPSAMIQGINNAFATVNNIVNVDNGTAFSTTPAGNGSIPTTEINSIASILANCVDTTSSSACSTIFADTKSADNVTPPTIFRAGVNMAANPSHDASALYSFVASGSDNVFGPVLTTAPHDWTIAINYTGTGIASPLDIAIDASNNVWATSYANNLIELNNLGSLVSPATGYLGGGLSQPNGLAIDHLGHVWIANCGGLCAPGGTAAGNVSEFDNTGNPISPVGGVILGGTTYSSSVAIDPSSNVWITNDFSNTVAKLDNTGASLTPGAYGFTTPTLSAPYKVAVDSTGAVLIPNRNGRGITKLNADGLEAAGSPYTNISMTNPTAVAVDRTNNVWVGSTTVLSELTKNFVPAATPTINTGGINYPQGIAIDGSGSVWLANENNTISEIGGNGTNISPSTGFHSSAFDALAGIAIDQSGNLWLSSCGSACGGVGNGSLVEVLAGGTPVVTPLIDAITSSLTPSDATAVCRDWTFSYSATRSGTCSTHGGVKEWLN